MTQKILRLPTVIELTGLGRSTIYHLIANDSFPSQIELSKRSVGWLESDIERWIQERIENSKG